jgi:hypothetical protein
VKLANLRLANFTPAYSHLRCSTATCPSGAGAPHGGRNLKLHKEIRANCRVSREILCIFLSQQDDMLTRPDRPKANCHYLRLPSSSWVFHSSQ